MLLSKWTVLNSHLISFKRSTAGLMKCHRRLFLLYSVGEYSPLSKWRFLPVQFLMKISSGINNFLHSINYNEGSDFFLLLSSTCHSSLGRSHMDLWLRRCIFLLHAINECPLTLKLTYTVPDLYFMCPMKWKKLDTE